MFERRAKLERMLNDRILKECFLDELEPSRGRMTADIPTECDIFCAMSMNEEGETE